MGRSGYETVFPSFTEVTASYGGSLEVFTSIDNPQFMEDKGSRNWGES